jgi:hypothetical protein
MYFRNTSKQSMTPVSRLRDGVRTHMACTTHFKDLKEKEDLVAFVARA